MISRKKHRAATRARGKVVNGTAGPPLAAGAPSRLPLIDAVRGAAIVMMIAYHFLFDLNYFGFLKQNFYQDAFWIGARSVILTGFLTLAGISLTLAADSGMRWPRYGRRLALIAACAVLVSVGSYLMFPASWITFGVLHFIAVASVLGLVFARLYWANLVIGAALIAIGAMLAFPFFDHPWLNWFGLMTRKPVTEDYVPLLPWFGVVLIGMFAGKLFFRGATSAAAHWRTQGPVGRVLAWAGQHSLVIYMVHQPLLIGVLYLLLGHRR